MNLKVVDWKEFIVEDIFKCSTTSALDINEVIDGEIPYITRSTINNGLSGYCGNTDKIVEGNCITIGAEGVFAFYQSDCFVPGVKIYTLRNDFINAKNAMFIVTILNLSTYLYSYGRARVLEKLKKETIKLPVTSDNKPDWGFMGEYIESLNHKPLTTKNIGDISPILGTNSWKEFKLVDIFDVKGGYYNKKPEHAFYGKIPFLASTESNNGITEIYSLEDIKTWDKVGQVDNKLDNKIYEGNCIAVTVNGSVCNAFYQKDRFTCSHDITALYPKNHKINALQALFVCTIIMKEKYRWSYGRKPHDVKKFGKSIIKLPSKNDLPDWDYMEKYIKSLPYGDRI